MGDLPRLGGGVRQVQWVLARRSVLRLACRQHQGVLGPCVFGQPVLAPWQLHALQPDPRLRRKRLAKQAAGGHLAGAEDYVDAVYMVLAAAAHAQANAACDALV